MGMLNYKCMNVKKLVNSTRVIGLDLYRLIAMILITGIHYFGYANIDQSHDLLPINKLFVDFATSINSCFVDMFVLLTGFFLGKRICKKMRLIDLWFQALIVGIIMLVGCGIYSRDYINLKVVFHTLFPISTFTYWYLIPYGFLFLLSPYINRLLDGMDRRKFIKTILIWGSVMMLIEISPILSLDWFIGNYMSIVWFVYIYVIGAYLGRYGFTISWATWLIIGLFSFALMASFKVFDIHLSREMRLCSFCSLLPLLLSISLFYFMSKIKTLGKTLDKIISSLSVSSLCVYLVQEQSSFREFFWPFIKVTDYANSPYLILHWALTIIFLFTLAWITYQVYKFIYFRFIFPRIIVPLVNRFEATK